MLWIMGFCVLFSDMRIHGADDRVAELVFLGYMFTP